MAEHDPASEATQNKQTTRFQYPRGDAVIAKFFASNVYKSAALIDVIYLFHLDYGADADVSQILRERLMDSARSNGAVTPTPPATKRSVAMPAVTDNTDNTDSTESAATDDKSVKQPEKQSAQQSAEKSAEKTAAPDESEKQGAAAGEGADTAAQDTDTAAEKKSNTDTKSSDFNIAEMFD